MMKRTLAIRITQMAIVVLTLGAGNCDPGLSIYFFKTYGDVHGQTINVGDDSYVVYDVPEKGRMFIEHGPKSPPMDQLRQAAATYPERTGRSCKITPTRLLSSRRIEFIYACG
jgi:hypothetical protein